MFSGEVWLVERKLDRQSVGRLYTPELRIRAAGETASCQRAAPFCRPPALTVPVNTSAFRYMFARMALAEPLVKRPRSVAGRVTKKSTRLNSSHGYISY